MQLGWFGFSHKVHIFEIFDILKEFAWLKLISSRILSVLVPQKDTGGCKQKNQKGG